MTAGQQLTIIMTDSEGDADLYLYPPASAAVWTDSYVASSENVGNSERIQGPVARRPKHWGRASRAGARKRRFMKGLPIKPMKKG